MKKILRVSSITVFLFLLLFATLHCAVTCLKSFTFNEDNALHTWRRMILNGKVDYSLIKYGDDGFVKAFSEKACSALYHKIGYNLKNYPLLSWKWRVLKFPDTIKAASEQEKNDYAARVYVIFPFFNFSSSKFIEYIWSKDIPVGTVLSNPAGKNIKTLVVRSGPPEEGGWASEARNVYEDYLKLFGRKPGRKVGAIAIMCNADNTKTQAESLFDDIIIASQSRPAGGPNETE